MGNRPGWQDSYWKRMDKETAKRIRTSCPKCGSTNTYYNKRFGTWRCIKCEHSFVVRGINGSGSWWKRLFRRQ